MYSVAGNTERLPRYRCTNPPGAVGKMCHYPIPGNRVRRYITQAADNAYKTPSLAYTPFSKKACTEAHTFRKAKQHQSRPPEGIAAPMSYTRKRLHFLAKKARLGKRASVTPERQASRDYNAPCPIALGRCLHSVTAELPYACVHPAPRGEACFPTLISVPVYRHYITPHLTSFAYQASHYI